MLALNLYTTSHCHLCEQAEAILNSIVNDYDISWNLIEIADNDQLLEAYGTNIPVIQVIGADTELAWPFDTETVLTHIKQIIPKSQIKQ
ncbi:glutaredoxin family protein [Methylotenera sp. L2L1]|uniref:glutaredoxin family protein n=1 Tax=Methylotenera sp. L2L1 TaxID=1502770 RepID=UPI0005606752|nr:glutaredoxin family protein [Methylotenera sp. L2L1]